MNPLHDFDARLDRIETLWAELATAANNSPRYKKLLDDIHTESVDYLASVDAARGVDRDVRVTEGHTA
jgi:hypothetical protein